MNGMPLLSQPPPENSDQSDESTCRKCNKEFNFLFTRQKRCNHCGYAYCSSCADFQALMPRIGPDTGYEVYPVCGYCMDMLTITASSKGRLRALPLSKLRGYMKAYGIKTDSRALEKDDLVETIIRARGLNGCLLPTHEDYYRKNSVPKRQGERQRTRSFFGRPPRQPSPPPLPQQQQRQYAPPPGPPPPHARANPPPQPQPRPGGIPPQMPFPQPQPYHHSPTPPQQPFNRTSPPQQSHAQTFPLHQPQPHRPSPPQPTTNTFRPSASQTNFHPRPPSSFPAQNQPPRQPRPPPRPRSAAPTVPATPAAPPPPPPSLDSLLEKSPDQISHLSISVLKAVLFQNRVNSSSGVLEKEDLVRKVLALVEDEKWDRQRKEREEREEAERMEWARREREKQEEERKAAERERKLMEERLCEEGRTSADGETARKSTGDEPRPKPQPAPASVPFPERTQDGLCVICQDEHANMAIIDCGHLALCKGCSEIVMKTSRECPLCRTRIVTEQRLLRIFKT